MNKIMPIILRYLAIFILSLNSLYVFYLVLTPLTVYPVYFILKIFYSVSLYKTSMIVNDVSINLVDACIAGSAYFLLMMLNFSTPKIKKRILVLAVDFLAFLALNIIRIAVLASLFLSDFAYFMHAHLLSWYALTAFFVVAIWIATVKVFKIKETPFYSDFICIRNLPKKKRKNRILIF